MELASFFGSHLADPEPARASANVTVLALAIRMSSEGECRERLLAERDIYNDVILKPGAKMSPETTPDRTLDCIGLYCPEPVFRTRVELDRMRVNEVLEVLADDPAAEEDIKSLARRIGHDLLRTEKKGNAFRFLIRKMR